jgi:hypothetical protein
MARLNWERNNKVKKTKRQGIDIFPTILTLPTHGRTKLVRAAKVGSSKEQQKVKVPSRRATNKQENARLARVRAEEDEKRREAKKEARKVQEAAREANRQRKKLRAKAEAEKKSDPIYRAEQVRKVAARAQKRMQGVVVERRLQSGRTVVLRGLAATGSVTPVSSTSPKE